MPTKWIREMNTSTVGVGTGYPFFQKCLALFLQNCCGYGNATDAPVSGSFFSTEKSGTNGSINPTASDKDFEDTTAASFVAGDVNKWLLVNDTVNPSNSGWYKITALVSASKVTIDFRSAAAEYPVQNTGANLSWWLMADNYDCPITDGDYWRLQTPHAAGWEVEAVMRYSSNNKGIEFRVAADGSWAGSKILPTAYLYCFDSRAIWSYVVADTEGENLHIATHNATDGYYQGIIVSRLAASEADRLEHELVGLTGPKSAVNGTTYQRNYSNNYLPTDVWSDQIGSIGRGYFVEMSYQNNDEGVIRYGSKQVNHRNGDKWDILDGSPILIDPTNVSASGTYEWPGFISSIKLIPQVASVRTAYDYQGTKDVFHMQGGLGFEWPGVTPQH